MVPLFPTDGILLGAAGAIITAMVTWFSFVRTNKKDETAIALEAWKELISPMKVELEGMKVKEAAREKAMQELIQEVNCLRAKLETTERDHRKERQQLLNRIRDLEDKQAQRIAAE